MKIEINDGLDKSTLIPVELMQRLDLKRGQQLHVTELAGGGFKYCRRIDFEKTMQIVDEDLGRISRHAHRARQMNASNTMPKSKSRLWVAYDAGHRHAQSPTSSLWRRAWSAR